MSLTSCFANLLHLCLTCCSCPPLISELSHLLVIHLIFVVSSYAFCICRRIHCLFDALLPLLSFPLSLECLMVQQTQYFFTLWTVILLKHLFKIISVWLCYHSIAKYFYTMASYTISAFGFNQQYCMLITAFSIYNCHKILFSYWKKKEKFSVHKSFTGFSFPLCFHMKNLCDFFYFY